MVRTPGRTCTSTARDDGDAGAQGGRAGRRARAGRRGHRLQVDAVRAACRPPADVDLEQPNGPVRPPTSWQRTRHTVGSRATAPGGDRLAAAGVTGPSPSSCASTQPHRLGPALRTSRSTDASCTGVPSTGTAGDARPRRPPAERRQPRARAAASCAVDCERCSDTAPDATTSAARTAAPASTRRRTPGGHGARGGRGTGRLVRTPRVDDPDDRSGGQRTRGHAGPSAPDVGAVAARRPPAATGGPAPRGHPSGRAAAATRAKASRTPSRMSCEPQT